MTLKGTLKRTNNIHVLNVLFSLYPSDFYTGNVIIQGENNEGKNSSKTE